MKMSSILTSSRKKSFFVATALVVLPVLTSPIAMAFGGGNGSPFSNGTFFPNEGTFQTTVRGLNLSGVATFSTGTSSSNSTSTSTSSGTFTVVYQGLSYTGNVDASYDAAAAQIAATMEASVTGTGNGTLTTNSTQTLSSTYGVVGTQTDVIELPSTSVTSFTGNITVVPGGQTTVTSNILGWQDTIYTYDTTTKYQDTYYVSGSFAAKLQNSYPNQIFKGKGSMTFTSINFTLSPPVLASATVAISVKGVRISDTVQSYADQTVQAPSVFTTISTSLGTTNRSTN